MSGRAFDRQQPPPGHEATAAVFEHDGLLRLHPADLEAIAERMAEFVSAGSTPWMSADEAAGYMRCPISRVRKLTMTGELPHERDGRRVLYHRDQLDQFIREGGAFTP